MSAPLAATLAYARGSLKPGMSAPVAATLAYARGSLNPGMSAPVVATLAYALGSLATSGEYVRLRAARVSKRCPDFSQLLTRAAPNPARSETACFRRGDRFSCRHVPATAGRSAYGRLDWIIADQEAALNQAP